MLLLFVGVEYHVCSKKNKCNGRGQRSQPRLGQRSMFERRLCHFIFTSTTFHIWKLKNKKDYSLLGSSTGVCAVSQRDSEIYLFQRQQLFHSCKKVVFFHNKIIKMLRILNLCYV